MSDSLPFIFEDDPAFPGWKRWELPDPAKFNAFLGAMHVRVEGGVARVRMVPEERHTNLRNHVHGGALLGFMDCALFGAARGFDVLTAGGASTLDLSAQFITGAEPGTPLEARVELLRETGRLLFMRGLVTQDETIIASFTGTVRKASA
ncbi:PaaI family thioesterase [Sphingomonas sp.]|uniref:PaaI family thioesterase n=1 Tax=Sphingomonas sp. TaxID=28214 RepID=UPI001B0439EF|nr:PaaI family thioesterase [Sphingomonas sp.]MBO9714014.1 PaaI family thioesterase [Sphingomonas sp.]